MQFCDKCGSILQPGKKGNKSVMKCGSCGATKDMEQPQVIQEVTTKEEVRIMDEDAESLPLTEAECEKCGHNKAYFWLQQTRAGDEPETKFLKCEKCKHTWREYD